MNINNKWRFVPLPQRPNSKNPSRKAFAFAIEASIQKPCEWEKNLPHYTQFSTPPGLLELKKKKKEITLFSTPPVLLELKKRENPPTAHSLDSTNHILNEVLAVRDEPR